MWPCGAVCLLVPEAVEGPGQSGRSICPPTAAGHCLPEQHPIQAALASSVGGSPFASSYQTLFGQVCPLQALGGCPVCPQGCGSAHRVQGCRHTGIQGPWGVPDMAPPAHVHAAPKCHTPRRPCTQCAVGQLEPHARVVAAVPLQAGARGCDTHVPLAADPVGLLSILKPASQDIFPHRPPRWSKPGAHLQGCPQSPRQPPATSGCQASGEPGTHAAALILTPFLASSSTDDQPPVLSRTLRLGNVQACGGVGPGRLHTKSKDIGMPEGGSLAAGALSALWEKLRPICTAAEPLPQYPAGSLLPASEVQQGLRCQPGSQF